MVVQALSDVDFSVLLDTLLAVTAPNPVHIPAEEVEARIESCFGELQKVLFIPPKSDSSRQTIKSGKFPRLRAKH